MYNCSTCEVVRLQQKKIENLLKLIKIQEDKIKELKGSEVSHGERTKLTTS
jgi:hypothetical protein